MAMSAMVCRAISRHVEIAEASSTLGPSVEEPCRAERRATLRRTGRCSRMRRLWKRHLRITRAIKRGREYGSGACLGMRRAEYQATSSASSIAMTKFDEGRDGEAVLDVGGDFAELGVFDVGLVEDG